MNVQLVAAEKLNQCNQVSRCEMKLFVSGFPRRLENRENENGHGKGIKHEKMAKNQKIVLSHGILPILPPNCANFVFFWIARNQAAI